MTVDVQRVSVAGTRWETATHRVSTGLRTVVRRLSGYDEQTPGPSARPELPGTRVVVIVQAATPIDVDGVASPRAFVAGLGPGSTRTTHLGHQRGLQLDLQPAQARRILGVPLSELAGAVVSLDDLLGPHERGLVDHLIHQPSWAAMTASLERWVGERWRRGRAPDRRIAGALQTLQHSEGRTPIAALQAHAGLSRPHLVRLFREHVGIPPKLFARLLRFEAVQARVRESAPPWASMAAELGFSDQAHLAREVRALCGLTPTQLAGLLG